MSSLHSSLLDRLTHQFGAAISRDIQKALQKKRLPTLRVNTLCANDQMVMNVFKQESILFERIKNIPHAFLIKNKNEKDLLALELAKNGSFYLQGLSSILPPLMLDPKPGEKILDLCAAPGSKTSQMAAQMENQGEMTAIEKDTIRIQKLKHTLDLQQVKNTIVLEGDAVSLCKTQKNDFNRILADVPCSAEGRICLKDPRSHLYWSEKISTGYAKEQRRLLRAAIPLLKPGGILVYSTCTLSPKENEEQMDWVLQEFPFLKTEPCASPLPGKYVRNNGFYLFPTEQHEGLFITKLCSVNLKKN